MPYRITIINPDGTTHDSGEGPFETLQDAIDFQRAEVGAISTIVEAPHVWTTEDGTTFYRRPDGRYTDTPDGQNHDLSFGPLTLDTNLDGLSCLSDYIDWFALGTDVWTVGEFLLKIRRHPEYKPPLDIWPFLSGTMDVLRCIERDEYDPETLRYIFHQISTLRDAADMSFHRLTGCELN
jgi:hypothetical protein